MKLDVLLTAALVALPCLSGCAVDAQDDTTEDAIAREDALGRRTVDEITTISYAPNSFVIGNAYPGWTHEIQGNPQFSHGAGNEGGAWYRWGYMFGEGFDRCAWVGNSTESGTEHEAGSKCGSPQQINTPLFAATYTNGMRNTLAGDGSVTHMHYSGSGCSDKHGYGNVEPWRVPATPHNSLGSIADGTELRWRYVTKDGDWVLVRQPGQKAGLPNWYFVHRGCVSLANAD